MEFTERTDYAIEPGWHRGFNRHSTNRLRTISDFGPNYADAPPEVVLMRPAFQQDPGSKVTLRWTSTDDVGIASHKILFSPVGNWPGSFQTVATLPGNQRSYEWTVPNIGNTVNGDDAFIKVVAVDTTGKESFDEAEIIIPTNAIAGNVQFSLTAGQTVGPGEMLASVYTTSGIDPYLTRKWNFIWKMFAARRAS